MLGAQRAGRDQAPQGLCRVDFAPARPGSGWHDKNKKGRGWSPPWRISRRWSLPHRSPPLASPDLHTDDEGREHVCALQAWCRALAEAAAPPILPAIRHAISCNEGHKSFVRPSSLRWAEEQLEVGGERCLGRFLRLRCGQGWSEEATWVNFRAIVAGGGRREPAWVIYRDPSWPKVGATAAAGSASSAQSARALVDPCWPPFAVNCWCLFDLVGRQM